MSPAAPASHLPPTLQLPSDPMTSTAPFRFRSVATFLSLAAVGIASGLLAGKLYLLWQTLA